MLTCCNYTAAFYTALCHYALLFRLCQLDLDCNLRYDIFIVWRCVHATPPTNCIFRIFSCGSVVKPISISSLSHSSGPPPLPSTSSCSRASPQTHLLSLLHQTQNVMYDLVSELQERSEELDKRIGTLEDKLDSVTGSLQALPCLISQAITQQQQDFLDGFVHRFRPASLASERSERSERSWTSTARRRRSPSTAPHTSSDSG